MPHLTLQQRIYCVKKSYSLNNVSAVCRSYEEEFGVSVRWNTVQEIIRRFEETGSVEDRKKPGRTPSVTNDNNQLIVAEVLSEEPQNSTRRLSRELQLSQTSIVRLIRKLGLKVWRPRLVQMLNEDDFDRRMQFCEDFNTFDYRDVIWTDEAKFNLNGQLNRHNCVYYSEENPHKIFEKSVNSPGVMVWAGICSRAIIGPFFFQGTVTGDSYLNMLETFALPRVVQLTDGAGDQPSLWWQQDGAPPHYSRAVRAWLDNNFPNKWIGRRGPVEWPARSPDLSPMDYSVWGIVKELVFSERPRDLEHLRERITGAFQIFNGDLCSNICNSLPSRIQHCIQENGGLFEHKRQ